MKIPEYLIWGRKQPCNKCFHPHAGEMHHCGSYGTAKRNHDEDALSLCRLCHDLAENKKLDKDWLKLKAKHQFECWLETLASQQQINILKDLSYEKKYK